MTTGTTKTKTKTETETEHGDGDGDAPRVIRLDGAEALRVARRLGLDHVYGVVDAGRGVDVQVPLGVARELVALAPGSLYLDVNRRGTRYDRRFTLELDPLAHLRAWWGVRRYECVAGGFWLAADGVPDFTSAVLDEIDGSGKGREVPGMKWSVIVEPIERDQHGRIIETEDLS